MRRFTWLAGLAGSGVLVLLGAVDGCSSSSDHPPVLNGTYDSGHPSSSSGGQPGGSSGGSSGSSSGGMICVGPDAGCTDLTLCGPKVNVNDVNDGGALPTPQGGPIVPGVYVLTNVDYYGAGIGWLKQTMRLTAAGGDGGAAEGGDDAAMAEEGGSDGSPSEGGSEGGVAMDASVIDAGGGVGPSLGYESIIITDSSPLSRASGTLSFTNPTTINMTATCIDNGNGMPFIAGYTATATTLSFIVSSEVLTYKKQ